MILGLSPGLWLLIAFALSLLGNGALAWQWAQAEAECARQMAERDTAAAQAERKRADKADERAVGIGAITAAKSQTAARKAQERTHARDQDIRAAGVTGQCRMPDRLPDLSAAVDEANAAAGL